MRNGWRRRSRSTCTQGYYCTMRVKRSLYQQDRHYKPSFPTTKLISEPCFTSVRPCLLGYLIVHQPFPHRWQHSRPQRCLFLPTIVKGLKFSKIETQLHSVPPFAAAWSFSILNCFIAAKARHALSFVVFPLCLAFAGVGIFWNTTKNSHLEYAAVFLITVGLFAALPVALCWYVMNLEGHSDRAVGTGWMISFGKYRGYRCSLRLSSYKCAKLP